MKVRHLLLSLLVLATSGAYAQSTDYASYGNSVTVDMGNELTVTPSGQANYEIPIRVHPGTGGMSPKLSIVYNSSNKTGLCGYGFDLAGLSMISRVPQNKYNDGIAGTVNFTSSDQFSLDGARLINISNDYGAREYEYRTENNSFVKITASNDPANPELFTVQTKDGLTYEYTASAILLGGTPQDPSFSWMVTKVTDTMGNYFTVSYNGAIGINDIHPKQIDYTGNAKTGLAPHASITFTYGYNDNALHTYIGGIGIARIGYITQIKSSYGQSGKTYNLSYATVNGRMELSSITESNAYNKIITGTDFNWENVTNVQAQDCGYKYNTLINKAALTTGDFNGDGKMDFVAYPENEKAGWTGYRTFISTGSDFTSQSSAPLTNTGDPTLQVITGDFNGDGYDDLIELSKNSHGYYYTYLYLASVSNGIVTFKQDKCVLTEQRQYSIHTIEADGDGIADLLVCYVNSNEYKIYRANHPSSSMPGEYAVNPFYYMDRYTTGSKIDRLEFVDFNGDGITDILNVDDTGFEMNHKRYTTFTKNDYYSFGDFNGDGKTDVLMAGTDDNVQIWKLRMADGKDGFKGLNLPSKFLMQYYQIFVADINGDGLDDLYAIERSRSEAATVPAKVYINDGIGNFNGQDIGVSTNTLDKSHYYIGDFNGDGKSDFIYTANWTTPISTWSGFNLCLIEPANNALVNKIRDGMSRNETVITYKNLTDPLVYQRTGVAEYPIVPFTPTWPVVYQVTAPSGVIGSVNKTTYTYKNALVHKNGRGYLGFEYFIAKDEVSGITTTTQFEVEKADQRYVMAVKHTDTKLGYSVLSTTDIQNVVLRDSAFYNPYQIGWNSPDFSYIPASTTERAYEYNTGAIVSNVTTTNEYDNHGNITKTTSSNGETATTTVNTYTNDESKWIIGRLTSSVVTKTNSTSTIVRRAKFDYDPNNGLLVAEYTEPDNPAIGYKKTYAHDAFGNITQSTTTPNNSAFAPRTETTGYDSSGRFLMSSTNSLGFTTKTMPDQDMGFIRSSTDPNGIVTTYNYDALEHLQGTSTPISDTKTITGWSYGYADAPATALYFTYTKTTGEPYTVEFFDWVGRSVRKVTEGLNGRKIYEDVVYNAKGQVEKTSEPYFIGDAIYWNTNTYDAVGRIIRQTTPDGSSYTMRYNGLTTTTTDPLGHSTTKVMDMGGNLVESVDDAGGRVDYTYDANGKCTQVRGPRTAINMEYDTMGNRTLLDDPDLGVSTSTYNAFGEVVSQTDGKGTTTYLYDNGGRVLEERRPDVTIAYIYDVDYLGALGIEYTYDAVGNSIGHDYEHDGYGRVVRDVYYMDDNGAYKSFLTSLSYNSLNQLDLVMYPSALSVWNEYSENGTLLRVSDNDTDKTYWQLGQLNARGQIEKETYGNGLTTTTTYNAAKGYITNISTPHMQDWYYAFNAVGNLTMRRDNAKSLAEQFEYDDLDRLVTVSRNSLVTQQIQYDNAGNITAKSDITPHADYSAGTNRMSGFVYGGHIPKLWDEIRYNSLNKIDYARMGSHTLSLTYGPDKSRVMSVEADSAGVIETKFYAGKYFEQDIRGDEVIDIYYIFASGKAVAIYEGSSKDGNVLRYLHHDHLGSIMAYSDENGNLAQELSYDAWGRRRNPNTWEYYSDTELANAWQDRGFGGHEHLDAFDMVNMDGRMYDPVMGRFLSPDPFVQAPDYTQGLNRYAYCLNNPLSLIDPSGYSWFSKNWKSLFAATVGIAVSVVTMGSGAGLGLAVIAGAAGGAAGALTGALINGANFGQIAKATLLGGLFGAASGYFSNISGEASTFLEKLFCHTTTNGFLEAVQGGNILHGFMVGAIAGAGGSVINDYASSLGKVGEVAANAVLSGTVSEIGGGKFANGAITGAFAMMFNEMMHPQRAWEKLKMPSTPKEKGLGLVFPEFDILFGGKLMLNLAKDVISALFPHTVTADELGISSTMDRIDRGIGLEEYNHDGTIFENNKNILPHNSNPNYYKEYVHPTPGIKGPGHQRIVIGGGKKYYYSPDHYHTFIRFKH